MNKKTILDVDFQNKKTILRVDFNVPLKNGVITDDNRIVQALPTISYLLEHGAKLILLSHLGRVKEEKDVQGKSLEPVARRLSELLGKPVKFVADYRGKAVEDAVSQLKSGEVVVLENTRFADLDNKAESKNSPELGKYWAGLGEIFVNDAFGVCHRAQASNVGIANHLPCVCGFLMEKEIKYLSAAIQNPKRPLVAIIGGAKVSDKIEVINNLLKICDYVLVAGGMVYTFAKAQGGKIGKSICEPDKTDLALDLLKRGAGKLIVGRDVYTGKKFSNDTEVNLRSVMDIPEDEEGLDCGVETLKLFKQYIDKANTVIWNGPLGVFELPVFSNGTYKIAEYIAAREGAMTVVGGGDSAAAIAKANMIEKFTHVSTGGGASLEFFEGKTLPGIECILDK